MVTCVTHYASIKHGTGCSKALYVTSTMWMHNIFIQFPLAVQFWRFMRFHPHHSVAKPLCKIASLIRSSLVAGVSRTASHTIFSLHCSFVVFGDAEYTVRVKQATVSLLNHWIGNWMTWLIHCVWSTNWYGQKITHIGYIKIINILLPRTIKKVINKQFFKLSCM